MKDDVLYVLGDLTFEWNAEKATTNLTKHKLDFREGASVFQDAEALLLEDPEQFDDEVRFALVGYSVKRKLLLVVHVERAERLRIVSVRDAEKGERRLYEERKS